RSGRVAMYIRTLKSVLFLLLVVSLIGISSAWAQSASVAGTITDPSSAVVPGVTVTLTDTGTNISRAVTTNSSGRYFFADVAPGTYSLTASKAGFSTIKAENQKVEI